MCDYAILECTLDWLMFGFTMKTSCYTVDNVHPVTYHALLLESQNLPAFDMGKAEQVYIIFDHVGHY